MVCFFRRTSKDRRGEKQFQRVYSFVYSRNEALNGKLAYREIFIEARYYEITRLTRLHEYSRGFQRDDYVITINTTMAFDIKQYIPRVSNSIHYTYMYPKSSARKKRSASKRPIQSTCVWCQSARHVSIAAN